MPNTYNLPYTRFVRQAESPLSAKTDTAGIAEQTGAALRSAVWRLAAGNDSIMPVHSATQKGGHDDAHDACKFCGGYVAGMQRAYAACVAYRFRVPSEALTGTVAKLASVTVPLRVDRWLAAGARLTVYQSDSATPPETWADIRDGEAHAAAQLTVQDPRVDQTDEVTIALAAPTDAQKFVYVLLSLENYSDVRGYWIEGSARIVGNEVAASFDRAVTADAQWSGEIAGAGYFLYYGSPIGYADNCHQLLNENSSIPIEQVLAAYGSMYSAGATKFGGISGTKVGVDTGSKVYGAYCVRYVAMSSADMVASLRFSTASLLPLSGKNVAFKLAIWSCVLPDTTDTLSYLTHDSNGDQQSALFRGVGTPNITTRTTINVSPYYTENDPITLSKIGEATLADVDYTSSHTFPVSLSGGGVHMLVICIMPVAYWGAVGTSTYATWKPGELVYLK